MQESSNKTNFEHAYLMGLTQFGPPFPVSSPRDANRTNKRNENSYGSSGRSQRSYQPYPRIHPGYELHVLNQQNYFPIGRNEGSFVPYERHREQEEDNKFSYYRGQKDNQVEQSNVSCTSEAEGAIQRQNEVNPRNMETASSNNDYISCRCSSRTLKMLYTMLAFAFFTLFVIGSIVIARQSKIRIEIQIQIVVYLMIVIGTIGTVKLCCRDKSN